MPPLAARTPATKKKRARADETAPVDSSVAEEPSPEALAASGSAAEAELVQFTSKFRIHPKGQGVVCARREGLSLNEFVADYIGEIYPPWRWYARAVPLYVPAAVAVCICSLVLLPDQVREAGCGEDSPKTARLPKRVVRLLQHHARTSHG